MPKDRARDSKRVFANPASNVKIMNPITEGDIVHHERSTQDLPPHRRNGLNVGGSSFSRIDTEVSRSVEDNNKFEASSAARLPNPYLKHESAAAYGETSTSSDPQAAVRGAYNAASTMRNEKIKSGQFVKEGAARVEARNANEPKKPTIKIKS